MRNIGRILCYGSQRVPVHSWNCITYTGINRLYYIHSGAGGYIHKGKTYEFVPNTLYYIPFSAEFVPFSAEKTPIFHTYIDFEMIPPVITDDILPLSVGADERLAAAVKVFVLGGQRCEHQKNLSVLAEEEAFWKWCESSILYLVSEIAGSHHICEIHDDIVIKSMEIMHGRLAENIRIADIAQACYMNEDSFIRRFSRAVGTTPYAYLKNLRLRTAAYLRTSGLSLSEVAQKTGYSDASSLLHALKGQKNN